MDKYHYQKLNYATYQQILSTLLAKKELQAMGIQKKILAFTPYGYPIDCLEIGKGEKELFLVAGTHGSEIIGIDFILNFLNQLPEQTEFNPNLFKLIILPIQNPEGFDISSNTLKEIPEQAFQEKSYEYYLRYRTDSMSLYAIKDLETMLVNLESQSELATPNTILRQLKSFIKENTHWQKLSEARAIPNISIFNQKVNTIPSVETYQELQLYLLTACNQTIEQLKSNNIHDQFLYLFINELKSHLTNHQQIWQQLENNKQKKLYQQMFEKTTFEGLQNPNLTIDTQNIYKTFNHPLGSQIGHDATGIGINLNANNPLNPGIQARKENSIIYGPFVKSNIKNYSPGPLGTPSQDINNFTYAIENQVLENLIKKSYESNKYLATILYHGTGGAIFYKPYEPLMEPNNYQEYKQYNEELATIYQTQTSYKLLEESSTTGYGDYLRRTYPGVLLIELSKMGGNPIGPYGDINNIYRVFEHNTAALNNLFGYFQKNILTQKRR